MKSFVKTAAALLLAASSLMCLAACGKPVEEPVVKPAVDVDVFELADSIAADCKFDDTSLAKIDDKDFILTFFSIDSDLVADSNGKQVAAYVAASTPEMIICLKAVDASSAQKIYDDSIKPFISGYIDGYASYGPEQVPKLESAVAVLNNGYMIIVVCADNSAALTYVNGKLGN